MDAVELENVTKTFGAVKTRGLSARQKLIGQALLGACVGGLLVAQAAGGADGALDVRFRRALSGPAPERFQLEWDGEVALARVDGQVLHSLAPDWTEPEPRVAFAVGAGTALFRNLDLRALFAQD